MPLLKIHGSIHIAVWTIDGPPFTYESICVHFIPGHTTLKNTWSYLAIPDHTCSWGSGPITEFKYIQLDAIRKIKLQYNTQLFSNTCLEYTLHLYSQRARP